MLCPECDSSVELDQPVCGNCGAPLPKIEAPSTLSALWDDFDAASMYEQRAVISGIVGVVAGVFLAPWIVIPFLLFVAIVALFLRRSRGPDTLNLR